jgi:hypothetical protein
MAMDEDEKRESEQSLKDKKKEKAWYQTLNPWLLGGAVILAFVFISNIMYDADNRDSYTFWLIGLFVVLYLLAQSPRIKSDEIISPREAELLVERECERKKRWGQFESMSTYKIGPVSDLQHRDARGLFYNIFVEVDNPYTKARFYIAKVYAKGLERGYVTLHESIGRFTGREYEQEKTIIPDWLTKSREYPLMEKLLLRKRE